MGLLGKRLIQDKDLVYQPENFLNNLFKSQFVLIILIIYTLRMLILIKNKKIFITISSPLQYPSLHLFIQSLNHFTALILLLVEFQKMRFSFMKWLQITMKRA